MFIRQPCRTLIPNATRPSWPLSECCERWSVFYPSLRLRAFARHVLTNTQSGHVVLVVRDATKLRVVEAERPLPLAAALLAAVAAALAGL